MRFPILITGLLGSLTATLATCAAEVIPPAPERFQSPDAAEVPGFQRHVSPLLGRLGCNGRACHGSFQGQGGFRLSLFGYDFQQDHSSIRPRVTPTEPRDSLLLRKATGIIDHAGGQRLIVDSWQYRLLSRWIEAGARLDAVTPLRQLEPDPQEVRLARVGETQFLRVTARWENGTVEDVTSLCRFETRDDSVATIDSEGRVRVTGRGDTHIVVSYDSGVTAIPVLIPLTNQAGDAFPELAAQTPVDHLVLERLKPLGIIPSSICRDAEFLRRIRLDLTGTLPTPDEVTAFLDDRSSDKRQRLIDRLLSSPAYAAWWANRLCDITGNNPFRQAEGRLGQQLAEQWYAWIYRRVKDNTPYDLLVAGIVLATSREDGQRYEDYAAEMSSYLRDRQPGDFSRRPTLPHYWTRNTVQKPEDKALAFAHSFLGIRLQCAQCHKHPHDRWTQRDFQQFARFFNGLEYGIRDADRTGFEALLKAAGQPLNGNQRGQVTQEAAALAAEGSTVGWRELFLNADRAPHGHLDLLGKRVAVEPGTDPRAALMAWMREPDHPYFARAFVNRVWAGYFHSGLIEPVDDLNLANPPSNQPLLDYLSHGFVESGYDMHWLHREIVSSATYQRDWRPNETNRNDRRHCSRSIPRRLPAEVIYDAIKQAVAADEEQVTLREQLDRRAIGHLATRMSGTYAQRVFGQPERLMACDCERSNSPSLLQSIFLQNDPLIQTWLQDSGWLRQIEAGGALDREPDRLIQNAYLRTVSRFPTPEETRRAREYLNGSESIVAGLRDLLWSLLNSKEFILNH